MTRPTHIPRPRGPRGFSLIELIVALAISALLLTASFVALDASFRAYRRTTEEASSHTVSRLAMHRMLALIRTSHAVGPLPADPLQRELHSDYIEVRTPEGQWVVIRWDPAGQRLLLAVDAADGTAGEDRVLLGGVAPRLLEDGTASSPFRLAIEDGWRVRRVTIDLSIATDAEAATALHSEAREAIRLVGSASPRFNNP